jgi:CRISPR/Cas system Type II protein with McrA/HNH and RuvC-like nuclease domain
MNIDILNIDTIAIKIMLIWSYNLIKNNCKFIFCFIYNKNNDNSINEQNLNNILFNIHKNDIDFNKNKIFDDILIKTSSNSPSSNKSLSSSSLSSTSSSSTYIKLIDIEK